MVAPSSSNQYILPVRFQLLVGAGVLIVFGGHLRQNAVTQSPGGVAEGPQPARPEHLLVYGGPGHNNFGALGVDASDGCALLPGKPREPLKQLAYGIQSGVSAGKLQRMGGFCQGGRSAGGGHRDSNSSLLQIARYARNFLRDKVVKPLECVFFGWIVPQELLRQPDRPQRKGNNF